MLRCSLMSYRTIIVAVENDHSDNAVCDRAVAIAKNCDAQIILFHVVEPLVVPVTAGMVGAVSVSTLPPDDERQAEILAENRAQLKERAEKIGDLVVDQRVVESALVCDSIHEVAEEFNADLIVAGSPGRHGLSLFFVGSTTSDLLKNAPCDILAVRITDD